MSPNSYFQYDADGMLIGQGEVRMWILKGLNGGRDGRCKPDFTKGSSNVRFLDEKYSITYLSWMIFSFLAVERGWVNFLPVVIVYIPWSPPWPNRSPAPRNLGLMPRFLLPTWAFASMMGAFFAGYR